MGKTLRVTLETVTPLLHAANSRLESGGVL